MAQRVEILSVTCPVSTPQASAIETELPFNIGIVREVEIVIPPGHAGLTGLAIAQAHQIIIPATGTDWIIGDDDYIKWPLENYLDADTWSAFTYNTDAFYPHSWQIRFLVDELDANVPAGSTGPIAVGDIYAAATASASS